MPPRGPIATDEARVSFGEARGRDVEAIAGGRPVRYRKAYKFEVGGGTGKGAVWMLYSCIVPVESKSEGNKGNERPDDQRARSDWPQQGGHEPSLFRLDFRRR